MLRKFPAAWKLPIVGSIPLMLGSPECTIHERFPCILVTCKLHINYVFAAQQCRPELQLERGCGGEFSRFG